MDKQELIAKVASGEINTLDGVKEALMEIHGSGKKVKRALVNAAGLTKSDGNDPEKNLSLYIINFDRALNPSESSEYDSE